MRPEHGGQDAGKLDGRQEMIRRRGFIGGLLASPVAASINPTEYTPLANYGPSISDIAKMAGVNKNPSKADRLLDDVKEARDRVKLLKGLKDQPRGDVYDLRPSHIHARKATSEAVKDVLIREWRGEQAMREAEADLARALWRVGAPDWIKELL